MKFSYVVKLDEFTYMDSSGMPVLEMAQAALVHKEFGLMLVQNIEETYPKAKLVTIY